MELKSLIQESLEREYHYAVKIAKLCDSKETKMLEDTLVKYDFRSATDWKRLPIQENPQEFTRLKGAYFTSEVCSTVVTLGYPVNERVLEVYLAVNMGIPHERVIVYNTKDPRYQESTNAAERKANDVDRYADAEDAQLANDEYEDVREANEEILLYGEEFNEKFLEEIERIRAEKGDAYFRNYPSKDNLMGQQHAQLMNDLMNIPNQGKGRESTKEVDVINQSARRN
jgi:hypothetical protein